MKTLAKKSGVHPLTTDFLFALRCAASLRLIYRQRGWSDELFLNTMDDLRCKLQECRAVYGIWGTFVGYWFRGFFICDRHGLGRLQYEPRTLKYPFGPYEAGTPVYNCHIPSSGPLTPDSVVESLKKAYEFYRPEDGILKVICSSWMLYPPMYEIYPEGSNLRAFYDCFTILNAREAEENNNLWRIFGAETDLEKLPENNRFQKRLKEYLLSGKRMGHGYGILLFDGEKILK